LAYLLERAAPEFIIIERDSNWVGAVDEIRADLATARSLVVASASVTATVRAAPDARLSEGDVQFTLAGGAE